MYLEVPFDVKLVWIRSPVTSIQSPLWLNIALQDLCRWKVPSGSQFWPLGKVTAGVLMTPPLHQHNCYRALEKTSGIMWNCQYLVIYDLYNDNFMWLSQLAWSSFFKATKKKPSSFAIFQNVFPTTCLQLHYQHPNINQCHILAGRLL